MHDNPTRVLIANSPMHFRQYVVVALCCLINMADGYDVLSLALAAPKLTAEWGVKPQMLGVAFGATSVGLALGAFLVAPLADRIGRRLAVLGALTVITIVHWLSAFAVSISMMMVLRFAMGIGLGTLVVSLNVLVSEYSNDRWRNLLLAFLHTGFSLGMAVSGAVAVLLLEPFGWRSIFITGGVLNMAVLLCAILLLLESPEYLTGQQPRNALVRLNAVLVKLNQKPMTSLPSLQRGAQRKSGLAAGVATILAPGLRRPTILLWIVSFSYALVGYFLLNWKPQILVNAGLTPTQASYVGIVNGICGTVGHISIGFLSRWVEENKITGIYFGMLAVMLVVFGTMPAIPLLLLASAGILTLFTVGAYTGLFLIAIKLYSTETRNTGVGFVVGWGRLGAIIGPMLGGLLIGGGLDREMTFAVFTGIAIVPFVASFMAVARNRQLRPATLTK